MRSSPSASPPGRPSPWAGSSEATAGTPRRHLDWGTHPALFAAVRDLDLAEPRLPAAAVLAPDPAPGSNVLLALDREGMDAYQTTSGHQAVEDVIAFPPGDPFPVDMATGIVRSESAETPRLFVALEDRLQAYDPSTYQLLQEVVVGGSVTDVHLSLDGRYVLLTRYPLALRDQTLVAIDAATLQVIRESTIGTCPAGTTCVVATPAEPMALTIDGSHAIVSNPVDGELDYVYLGPERAATTAAAFEDVVAAVPVEALESNGARQQLLRDVEAIVRFLRLAEELPDPAREQVLASALRELEEMIARFDGCALAGEPDRDDVVTVCAEQAGLYQVAGELAAMVGYEVVWGCPVETFE